MKATLDTGTVQANSHDAPGQQKHGKNLLTQKCQRKNMGTWADSRRLLVLPSLALGGFPWVNLKQDIGGVAVSSVFPMLCGFGWDSTSLDISEVLQVSKGQGPCHHQRSKCCSGSPASRLRCSLGSLEWPLVPAFNSKTLSAGLSTARPAYCDRTYRSFVALQAYSLHTPIIFDIVH